MGLALQIKLTATIFIPALLADITPATLDKQSFRSNHLTGCLKYLAVWICSCFLLFVSLVAAFPGWSVDLLWFTHQAASVNAKPRSTSPFQFGYLVAGVPMVFGACLFVCISLALWNWRKFSFFHIILLSVFTIHLLHVPFWDYYVIHFDVAMALSARIAASYLPDHMWHPNMEQTYRLSNWVRSAGFCVLVFTLVAFGGLAVAREWVFLERTEKATDGQFLSEISAIKNVPGQLFSASPLDGFYSGISLVPYLTVLPAKRYWCGETSNSMILAFLKHNKRTCLLLSGGYLRDPNWAKFVNSEYYAFSSIKGQVFYRARSTDSAKEKNQ